MVTMAAPMSSPRVNPTQDAAIAAVARDEGRGRLYVSIGERVGEQLVEAFERVARAYYGRQS
jgi:hypothetical protein